MNSSYKTVLKQAADEVTINRSRFIGFACPVTTEEEAILCIADIRKKHKDAAHNCYAYIIGENSGIMRYSDDGEPSGTAGMPIIEVMKAQGVVNCCIVVTRYFGGTLLGAGGLVRAYAQGSAIALRAAKVVTMESTIRVLCEAHYSLWDKVHHTLNTLPVMIETTDFFANVNFSLLIREEEVDLVLKTLTNLTNSNIDILVDETFYHPWYNTP